MSLMTDVLSTCETRGLGEVAGALGQSDLSISQGMRTAIGAVLGGMANKSGTPGMLQKIMDLAPTAASGECTTNIASAMTDPSSPLLSMGKRMLSMLFGGSEGKITEAMTTATGLPSGITSSLLAIAAPMVTGFLGKWMHNQGTGVPGLASMLQREAPAIRAMLPPGVSSLLAPGENETMTATAAAARAAEPGSSAARWVLPLALLALIPAIWLISHARRPVVEVPPAPAGTANRSLPDLGGAMPTLMGEMDLQFQQGSKALEPETEARLKDFVSTLAANPDAHISVSGFTDGGGSDADNMRLSQERADTVRASLMRMGIPADRITAKGFGSQNPIGDNGTPGGREANNRVTVDITNR